MGNLELSNCDVPLNVTNVEDNVFEVVWEEANDGDFNRDGLVYVSDISTIGQVYGDCLALNTDYELDASSSTWKLMRDTLLNDRLSVKNVSTKSQLSATGDYYSPVDKCSNGVVGPIYYPTVDSTWYLAEVSDFTTIGQNWEHHVTGYRIYYCHVDTGDSPVPGNFLDTPTYLCEVSRPLSFSSKIGALGMGEYNEEGQDLSYGAFCESADCFSGLSERGSQDPDPMEPRKFKKTVQIPELSGDTYILMSPTPGFCHATPAITDLGAYTYFPDPINVSPIDKPTSITWVNSEVGIQEIQLGGDHGGADDWRKGTGQQFRITFGEAQMNNHTHYSALGWQVKYAVFISRDSSSLFSSDDAGLPVAYYYPSNNDNRQEVIDISYSPEWLEFVDNPSEASTTLYVGVRAYPYKEYSTGFVDRLMELDSNNNSLSVLLDGIDPEIDESMPFMPLAYHRNCPFVKAWTIAETSSVDKDGNSYITYIGVPVFRGHPHNTNGSDSSDYYHPCSWTHHTMMSHALDFDEFDKPRDENELQLRVEYYRTTLEKDQLKSAVYSYDYFGNWLRAKSMTYNDVYGLTLSLPGENDTQYLQSSHLDEYFSWIPDGASYAVRNLNASPPYPWCGMNDDIDLLDFYTDMGYTLYSSGWGTGTTAWQICDSDWNDYDPESVIKCEGDFSAINGDMIRFVWDPTYETFYDSITGGYKPYNYFSVSAINDPLNNCNYDLVITWHGPVEQTSMNAWCSINSIDEYNYNYFASLGDMSGAPNLYRGTSTTSSDQFQARYPDIAFDSTRNTVGISYYSPYNGYCQLYELNIASKAGTIQDVESASYGDTSVTFDSNGNPHVAYYKITDSSTGNVVEQCLSGTSSSSSIRTSSVSYGGGIKYKGRISNVWGSEEDVDDNNLLNSPEHNIHYNTIEGDPYCIIPTTDSSDPLWALGIPGYSEPVTGISWDVDPLGTPEYVTSMTLDSISEVDGTMVNTYIAYYSDTSNSLHLGTYLNNSLWLTTVLDSDNVRGYPSIARLPNGNIGISYMAGEDNLLRYGEWNGSTFSIIYESDLEDSGYQTALSFDDSGNPIIYSLSMMGEVLETKYHTGDYWTVGGVATANVQSLLRENTLCVTRVGGADCLAYIGSVGTLCIAYLPYV